MSGNGLHMNDAYIDVYSTTFEALKYLVRRRSKKKKTTTHSHYEWNNQYNLTSTHNNTQAIHMESGPLPRGNVLKLSYKM